MWPVTIAPPRPVMGDTDPATAVGDTDSAAWRQSTGVGLTHVVRAVPAEDAESADPDLAPVED